MPPAPPGRTSSAVQARLRFERLQIAAQSGITASLLTLVAVAFIAALLQATVAPLALGAWGIATAAITCVRIGLSAAWRRGQHDERTGDAMPGPISTERLRRWERAHTAVALCCGLAWASLEVLPTSDVEQSTILLGFGLTLALVLGGSFYASNRLAYASFSLPIVVAQTVDLQRLSIDFHDRLAIAWLGLVAVLYVVPRFTVGAVRDGLVLRIEHERHAAEQAALLATAPLGILVVRGRRIAVCNDALLTMLGYGRQDDLVGRDVDVLMPDDDPEADAVETAADASAGKLAPRIVRRRRRDGTVIEVLRHVAIVPDGDGGTDHIGIYEDVHERLAIEEGFRHAVQMQRLVFESAGEGIAVVAHGRIEQANQALGDLLGVPAAQLTKRPLRSIFEDAAGWGEIERRFQRLGNTLKLERRLLRADGRPLWANVTGCLVETSSRAHAAERRSVWILADLSVQKQKEAENWHHANHDVMTGLPNRRFLQDRLDQALAFARRDVRRVAVLELDLDGFKAVNDRHGHRFGDAVLEEVARRLSAVVRELDTVGRWGGDEFVLVLKEIESRDVVEDTVRRVIARLSEPIVHDGHELSVGASIGIALFPDHGDEVEALMLAADLAMYESKSAGGNTWRFASATGQMPRGKYRPAPATVGADDS